MFKKNNLNLKIICIVILTFFLLNELEESLTFIVTQMYDLVINNLDTNMFRTSLTNKNNKLILFNTTFIDVYNLNIKLKDFII